VIDRVVALGGPPGSGKSTAGRALADELHLELINAGERFRAEAEKRRLDLASFSRYAETHPQVDKALDAELLELAAPGRLLEGRVQGALCRRRRIPVHWLSVVARPEVRAERLARRDQVSLEEAIERMEAREASERRRYLSLYDLDLDGERPDFTIDSSDRTPAEVVAALRGYLNEAGALRER
jgi:CMP/dCMP kinase